jgi:hypothetical protein
LYPLTTGDRLPRKPHPIRFRVWNADDEYERSQADDPDDECGTVVHGEGEAPRREHRRETPQIVL